MQRVKERGDRIQSSLSNRKAITGGAQIVAPVGARKPTQGFGGALLSTLGKQFKKEVDDFNASSAFEAKLASDDAHARFDEMVAQDPSLRGKSYEELSKEGLIDDLLNTEAVKNPLIADKLREQFTSELGYKVSTHNRQFAHEQTIDTYRKFIYNKSLEMFQKDSDETTIDTIMRNLKAEASDEGISNQEFLDIVMEVQSRDEYIQAKVDNTALAKWMQRQGEGGELYLDKAKQVEAKVLEYNDRQKNLKHNDYEREFNDVYSDPFEISDEEFELFGKDYIDNHEGSSGIVDGWRDERQRRLIGRTKTKIATDAYFRGDLSDLTEDLSQKDIQATLDEAYLSLTEADPKAGLTLHMKHSKRNGFKHKKLNDRFNSALVWLRDDGLTSTSLQEGKYDSDNVPKHVTEFLDIVPDIVSSGYVELLPESQGRMVKSIHAMSDGTELDVSTAASIASIDETMFDQKLKLFNNPDQHSLVINKLKSEFKEVPIFGDTISDASVGALANQTEGIAAVLLGSGVAHTQEDAVDKAIHYISQRWTDIDGVAVPNSSSIDLNNASKSISYVKDQMIPSIANFHGIESNDIDKDKIGFILTGKDKYLLSYDGMPMPMYGRPTLVTEKELFSYTGDIRNNAITAHGKEWAASSVQRLQKTLRKLEERDVALPAHVDRTQLRKKKKEITSLINLHSRRYDSTNNIANNE